MACIYRQKCCVLQRKKLQNYKRNYFWVIFDQFSKSTIPFTIYKATVIRSHYMCTLRTKAWYCRPPLLVKTIKIKYQCCSRWHGNGHCTLFPKLRHSLLLLINIALKLLWHVWWCMFLWAVFERWVCVEWCSTVTKNDEKCLSPFFADEAWTMAGPLAINSF